MKGRIYNNHINLRIRIDDAKSDRVDTREATYRNKLMMQRRGIEPESVKKERLAKEKVEKRMEELLADPKKERSAMDRLKLAIHLVKYPRSSKKKDKPA